MISDTSKKSYVDLTKARVDAQREVMEVIRDTNECPFCPKNIKKYHKKPILKSGKFWILTNNQWPYEYTELHLLAISTYHAEKLSDLHIGAFEELQDYMIWAEKEYNIDTGTIAMRFGDMSRNGATVNHLHIHLIVPSADKPNDKIVRFKIG